jgi:hypothetical protein
MRYVLLLLAACASNPVGTLRFEVAPPVTRVADRAPLEQAPAERPYYRSMYHVDSFALRRTTRWLDVRVPTRARDVNSLDEVPDSSWFTNRIGVREISLDELRRGANVDGNPFEHLPWTITNAKVGGTALGFIFVDARGIKHLLKFDLSNVPEMETGAHAIGHRLLWAAGYSVPQDHIGYIKRSDLVVSPKATKKDVFGNKKPLVVADLDKGLERVFHTSDGRIRVLASRFLPGIPIGPYARQGTRPDDPNDRIPHELRRSVRGEVPLFSWINHSDIQEDNTLDIFIPYPGPDGKPGKRGHVVHHLLDFGKAFGVMNNSNSWKTVGHTYRLDVRYALQSLITIGLWKRPWDGVDDQPVPPGIGMFDSGSFDPACWRTNSPYWPFEDHDRFDGYWGAKLVMRFTRAQIETAVGEAKYSNADATTYMVKTLLERQRKIGRYWFRQVSPLDGFAIESSGAEHRLCFDDLGLRYDTEVVAASRYEIAAYDYGGKRIGPTGSIPGAARTCTQVLPIAATGTAYTIVRLAAWRNAFSLPPVLVHVARDRDGQLRVIGIRRE